MNTTLLSPHNWNLALQEESTSSSYKYSSSLCEEKLLESKEEINPCEGELLLVRKLLTSQPVELEQSE